MTLPTDQELDRQLEKVKKEVFLGSNAAFLGSILCSQEFFWDRDSFIDKVGTNGFHIRWGVNDFLECNFEERKSTLLHELWHVAMLHHIRRGARCPDIWNIACDYRINNDLRRDRYFIPDTWVVNPELDANGIMAEEQIYDLLMQNALPKPTKPRFDLQQSGVPGQQTSQIAAVVRAVQAAKMAGQVGSLPGGVIETLNSFLESVIPWRSVLAQWMTDLMDSEDFTWKRPNRRFQDIYLPSREREEGKLTHLTYFIDTSLSISNDDVKIFNSEVKYIQEVLKPDKLTLVQFDTRITKVRVFTEDEPFTDIEIRGRGGTSLIPVRNWIEEHKPTAAIIYSDLFCDPMEPLTQNIPIIWAEIHHKGVQVPFGKVIHVAD